MAHADTSHPRATFSSGEQPVTLVELFTSEGCSSCPPADRWLSSLKSDAGLWTDFVPVAFHVDYWDYIGWKDRFARTEYSTRQRQYAEEGGVRVVYTPGFFNQGKEWRGWRRGESVTTEQVAVGNLNIQIHDDNAVVRFDSLDSDAGQLTVHIALLGMNIETDVRAGENKGRQLHHDFVALGVVSVPLDRSASGYSANTRLPEIPHGAYDLALAAWVSAAGAQKPLQSTGGLLSAR